MGTPSGVPGASPWDPTTLVGEPSGTRTTPAIFAHSSLERVNFSPLRARPVRPRRNEVASATERRARARRTARRRRSAFALGIGKFGRSIVKEGLRSDFGSARSRVGASRFSSPRGDRDGTADAATSLRHERRCSASDERTPARVARRHTRSRRDRRSHRSLAGRSDRALRKPKTLRSALAEVPDARLQAAAIETIDGAAVSLFSHGTGVHRHLVSLPRWRLRPQGSGKMNLSNEAVNKNRTSPKGGRQVQQ